MNGQGVVTQKSRTIALAAMIAVGLVILAMAVTQRGLNANGAALRLDTADFVVSSARDAGPGTFRDAILAADRLTTRAHIIITAKRITVESALPALVNPHGVDIDAASGSGTIDIGRQEAGAGLQVNSQTATVRGLRFVNAHVSGIIVNAPGVRLDSLTLTDSKVGILLSAAARDCIIRTSIFERNETGVLAEAGVRHVSILSSIFRGNTRAGFWLVAAAEKDGTAAQSSRAGAPGGERVRIADSVFEGNAIGAVIANQPTLILKSRFIGNRQSAVLILGGAARLEESEIRESGGTAVAVISGTAVVLAHNRLSGNLSIAISVRDSDVAIQSNTLARNGLGIVSIISQAALIPAIGDNLITETAGDAITLIGGAPLLQRNQILRNHGAGLRVLDLVQGTGGLKATPRLDANVIKGNGTDTPVSGVYTLVGAL